MSLEAFQDNFATAKDAGFLSDILVGDGERVYMRGTIFDAKLSRLPSSPAPRLAAAGGFLDDSYFKRITWSYGAARETVRGQLLAFDGRALYGVQMLSPRCLDPNHFFTPGKDGYTLQSRPLASLSPVRVANTPNLNPANKPLTGKAMRFSGSSVDGWSVKVPIRVQAIVAAPNALVVAGPPDLMDLAAFEGRAGGLLRTVGTADGKTLAELKLTAPPVFNGLAAGGGRLFAATTKGDVLCLRGNQDETTLP